MIPSERGKGYGTEAIQLMVDHLFLTKNVVRIQVTTDVRNVASQKALEKVGFVKEGTMRKYFYAKGNYRDHFLYSILREEWKEPKILTNQASQIKQHYSSHPRCPQVFDKCLIEEPALRDVKKNHTVACHLY